MTNVAPFGLCRWLSLALALSFGVSLALAQTGVGSASGAVVAGGGPPPLAPPPLPLLNAQLPPPRPPLPPPPPPLAASYSSAAREHAGAIFGYNRPPAPGSDEVCGLSMQDLRHERIVGGRATVFGEVPFIVHLRESKLFKVLGYHKCGGVILNHRWALTAAHCKPTRFSSLEIILGKHKTFEDAAPPEGSAMATILKMAGLKPKVSSASTSNSNSNEIAATGNDDDDDDGNQILRADRRRGLTLESAGGQAQSQSQAEVVVEEAGNGNDNNGDGDGRAHKRSVASRVVTIFAETVIVHPNYDPKTLENDLALIKLAKPVPYRKDIQPICLPHFDEDFTGLDAYAVGWGLLSYQEKILPDTLQIVRLPVISNKRCQSMYVKSQHEKLITPNDLCAGYARGGMDACEGDSGGPLIVRRPNDNRWTLAGIVSNGVECAKPLLPGVYTRVAKFVPWIRAQMEKY